MTIALILHHTHDAQHIPWATRVAVAREQPLILIWAQHHRRDQRRISWQSADELPPELSSIPAALADIEISDGDKSNSDNDSEADTRRPAAYRPREIVHLHSSQLGADLRKELAEQDISSVILIRRDEDQRRQTLQEQLQHSIDSEVIILIPGQATGNELRQVTLPVGAGPHSSTCLRLARDLASTSDATVNAVHVEPLLGDMSPQAAERFLLSRIKHAIGKPTAAIQRQVVMADDVVDGIQQAVSDKTDLILLGMKRQGLVRRFSRQGIAERLAATKPAATIAVVQSALPWATQLGRRTNEIIRSTVPQLQREDRLALVENIQASSRWDFDFIMLISLSALIAAGGLIQNSAAVVIGAMLVAPLMTPLLGAGLALVQGNFIQFRASLATVFKGFLLALAIGWALGWLVPGLEFTSEMQRRCQPSVLDIVIAAVGGIAAAYASGRPNLVSALPGVAIAASLVPPIATAGLAASQLGQWTASLGAGLLFLTNIVAIVLGTVAAFWAVGIRSTHAHSEFNRWTLTAGAGLVALTVGLGIYESWGTVNPGLEPAGSNSLNAPSSSHDAVDQPSTAKGAAQVSKLLSRLAERDRWSCRAVQLTNVGARRMVRVEVDSGFALTEPQVALIRKTVQPEFPDHEVTIVNRTVHVDATSAESRNEARHDQQPSIGGVPGPQSN